MFHVWNAQFLLYNFYMHVWIFSGPMKPKTYFLSIVWELESLVEVFAEMGSCSDHKRDFLQMINVHC